jgi:hypothetical protein
MKKLINIVALVISLSASLFAQESLSFRSKASGNIISDDLDLVYDPIELRYVNGYRLYSNLSNLNASEQVFSNLSNNNYLFGISGKNPIMDSLWTSVLISFRNSITADAVSIDSDLNGSTDISGYGTLIDIYSSFVDSNNDQIFDYRRESKQSKTGETKNKNYSIIFNNALQVGDMALGFRLEANGYETNNNDASYGLGNTPFLGSLYNSSTYSLASVTTLLNQNFVTEAWNETGDFNYNYKSNNQLFELSAMKPVGELELRANLLYQHENYLSERLSYFKGDLARYNVDNTDYENVFYQNQTIESKTQDKGNIFGLGAGIRKTFKTAAERKNEGFWALDGEIAFGRFNYESTYLAMNQFNEYFYDGADTLLTDYEKNLDYNYNYGEEGTDNRIQYKLSGKVNVPFSERIYFGLGANLQYTSSKRESNYNLVLRDQTVYDEFDALGTNDYSELDTDSESSDRNYNIQVTTYTLPIGLEYKFDKNLKWALRVGAYFYYQKYTTDRALQITNALPYVSTESNLSGSSVNIDNNSYHSYSMQETNAISRTVYTYGLGFNPSENLQIDLISFFGADNNALIDASFYRNLMVSFVLKF